MTARNRKKADAPATEVRPLPSFPSQSGPGWTLYHGDSASVLSALAPESIDAIVTDPPAGISFMGREWDGDKGGRDAWIAWLRDIMRKALAVLKPGGHALVWALPRTSHWTATAIEDAGFEIRDVGIHLFGTGFPKSLDVSKAIDFAGGSSPAANGDDLRARREAAGISQEDLAALVGCSAASIDNWERGRARRAGGPIERIVPGPEYRDRLREVIGYTSDERTVVGASGVRSGDGSTIGLGHAGTLRLGGATPAAARFVGIGTALKPAAEHWILARKPLAGTVASNALRFGTGGLRIDDCRIEGPPSVGGSRTNTALGQMNDDGWQPSERVIDRSMSAGRWPAHVTMDEEAARVLDEMSGARRSAGDYPSDVVGSGNRVSGGAHADQSQGPLYADAGGASRFFYVAKATRAEKDAGLDHLPLRTGGEATDREEGSAGLNSPRAGTGRTGGVRNYHPTVKSIELMRWLCRLVTPKGGTVLDMFCGSATTGLAAIAEGLRFVGIEQMPTKPGDPNYIDIAAGRLAHATCQPTPTPLGADDGELVKPAQPSLFDALRSTP